MRTIAALAMLVCTAAPAPAADLKPFKIGYNNWIGYIGMFVAKEKGYFKDEGLDVQAQSFSAPGDGLTPLLAGDLDAHLSTVDSVITALDKAPGRLSVVYLTDTSAGADAVIVKTEIATLDALKGKTVAATAGQCNEVLLRHALKKANLTMSDIKFSDMNPDDAGAAFAAGKLDAAVTWEPWLTKLETSGQGKIIFTSIEVPNLLLDVVAVSDKTLKERAGDVKGFVRALNKANEFAISEPAAAADIAAKPLDMKADEIVAMLKKVKLYGAADNKTQMTGPALSSAKELAQFFKDTGANSSVIDVSKLYDPSYIGK